MPLNRNRPAVLRRVRPALRLLRLVGRVGDINRVLGLRIGESGLLAAHARAAGLGFVLHYTVSQC